MKGQNSFKRVITIKLKERQQKLLFRNSDSVVTFRKFCENKQTRKP